MTYRKPNRPLDKDNTPYANRLDKFISERPEEERAYWSKYKGATKRSGISKFDINDNL